MPHKHKVLGSSPRGSTHVRQGRMHTSARLKLSCKNKGLNPAVQAETGCSLDNRDTMERHRLRGEGDAVYRKTTRVF